MLSLRCGPVLAHNACKNSSSRHRTGAAKPCVRGSTCSRGVLKLRSRAGRVAAAGGGRPGVPEVFVEGAADADPEITAFQAHQKAAARPSPAESARTWFSLAKTAVLATISKDAGTEGFPHTSVIEFAVDGDGKPMFAFSSLSTHTGHVLADGRVSLTVTSPGFSSMADGRVSLQARVREVTPEERPALREAFLRKNPNAFWIDFADFKFFTTEEVVAVHVNGGFGAARKLSPAEYASAQPDPVAQFSAPVCTHMNDDHQQDMKDMLSHFVGLTQVDKVTLTDLDRLGMNAEVKRKGQTFKLRLPFVKPAEDRKGIKDAIVEMTKTARGAKQQ